MHIYGTKVRSLVRSFLVRKAEVYLRKTNYGSPKHGIIFLQLSFPAAAVAATRLWTYNGTHAVLAICPRDYSTLRSFTCTALVYSAHNKGKASVWRIGRLNFRFISCWRPPANRTENLRHKPVRCIISCRSCVWYIYLPFYFYFFLLKVVRKSYINLFHSFDSYLSYAGGAKIAFL